MPRSTKDSACFGDTKHPAAAQIAYFRHVDYQASGTSAPRPQSPVVLYLGAYPERCNGMSWTGSPNVANTIASSSLKMDVGLVWRGAVEPDRLLGRAEYDGYDECIVDTTGLTIQPHQQWCRCPWT